MRDAGSGLAAGGYDPLAYFIERRARPGLSAFEAEYAGAWWRFLNEGNRAAFIARPDVYAPRYGGHDAWFAREGRLVEGDPLVWAVFQQRLYFFFGHDQRAAWAADPAAAIRRADDALLRPMVGTPEGDV